MKILLIILGVIVLAFVAVQLFAMSGQRNIETYPYAVKKEYADFEVRNYEASLFTSINLSSKAYEEVSSKGFSILAGYIFGGNDESESIPMTSPVHMTFD